MGEGRHAVLIADDHEADRLFLTEVIRRYAPQLQVVAELGDGEQVIAYLSGEGRYADRHAHPLPEVLFLDMRMPGLTGLEVLEWLNKQKLPPIKIAMLADSSSAAMRPRALQLGVQHFYSKLTNRAELIHLVKCLQSELEGGRKDPMPVSTMEIPPLLVDDIRVEAFSMPVIVAWGNMEISRFFTLSAAKAALLAERYLNRKNRSEGVRVFQWAGTVWEQVPGDG